MLILDTNVLSALRRPERSPDVAAWLTRQDESQLYLSVVTLGEIERGIARQEEVNPPFARDLRDWLTRTVTLFADRLLPFTATEAQIWGRLSARIGHDGADLLIAATALAHDATVVTGNVADFRPSGCRILDPFVPHAV
ncbi:MULTISPECIES: type II toxin-antitoxin system VapC family toxin [Paracoccus]|uniref:Ribonuclease VapC n=1 Tax=Paracoccus litorisediminis TaxID=2006130 RepID=A0A844HM91_9RHOB|nr:MULTISPECIES: type II toxin-antitoxin system VapC family toxin [Paracoccus]MBD9527401.1 type II toxin-antitoxin system VapC family toxin [Paracoccus sp. PAR01]MTH60199.1 PIN domain-containing protein [Paracoccus litorisediminis]